MAGEDSQSATCIIRLGVTECFLRVEKEGKEERAESLTSPLSLIPVRLAVLWAGGRMGWVVWVGEKVGRQLLLLTG